MDSSSSGSLSLDHLAIEAALDGRWEDAIKLNRKILKIEPDDVDSLNRQARAFFELGNLTLAKNYYQKALKFDPYNPIAQKNLKIIKAFKHSKEKASFGPNHNGKVSPLLFLQEPGKTKVVTLLKVAEPKRLSQSFCGMEVSMQIKNRKITVVDSHSFYLGVLPDDIAHQLIRLIRGGSRFKAVVKSIRVNGLSILIRETYRASKFRNQPSFLEFSQSSSSQVTIPDSKLVPEEIPLALEEEG